MPPGRSTSRKEDDNAEASAEEPPEKKTDYGIYAELRHRAGKTAVRPGDRSGSRTAEYVHDSRIPSENGE